MKTTDASPAGKKLKQARLSFGTPQPSPPKKPRIEPPPPEIETSAGPVTVSDSDPVKKANTAPDPRPDSDVPTVDLDSAEGDSDRGQDSKVEDPGNEKVVNPLVSLVDGALKRKLKKKDVKEKGKRKTKKDKTALKNTESVSINNDKCDSIEENKSKSESIEDNGSKNINNVIEKKDSPSKKSEHPVNGTNEPISIDDSDEDSKDDKKDNVPMEVDETNSHSDSPMETDEGPDPDEVTGAEDPETVEDDKVKKTPRNKVKRDGTETVTMTPPSSKKLTPEEREKTKAQRDYERLKRQKEKEQKAIEKQEKEEQRKLEREEKERIKEENRLKREEDAKYRQMKKEDQEMAKIRKKEARENEKRRREELQEEMKKRKENEKEKLESKKRKAAAAFEKHFIFGKDKSARLNESVENVEEKHHQYLSTFTVKTDMRLAPLFRNRLSKTDRSRLDQLMKEQNAKKASLYVSSLKDDTHKASTDNATWPLEDLRNEISIIEDDLPPVDDTEDSNQIIVNKAPSKTYKAKLLSFYDNRRPPYWGTWKKKSVEVTGRRPFAFDKTVLDYTYDSDEEWEEEEPGESVESIAGSDDDQGDNEYDVDNDFMVPHGYLSDEEMIGEDDSEISPETQKAKLKFLEHEFEDEMKKPTKIKQPRLIGIFWQNDRGEKPDLCPASVWNFLKNKSILSDELYITVEAQNNNDFETDDLKREVKKSKKIKEYQIPDLIRLVHGNTNNRGFLAKEFQLFVGKSNVDANGAVDGQQSGVEISKLSIAKKIKDISSWMPCPEEGAMLSKMCWFVSKEMREKYGMEEVALPNEWSYNLSPKRRRDAKKSEKIKPTSTNENKESPPKKDSPFNIIKFTKKLTSEEREKQFLKNNTLTSGDEEKPASPTVNAEKKRVSILFSGPRGIDLPNAANKPEESAEKPIEGTLQQKDINIQDKEPKSKKKAVLAEAKAKDVQKPCKTNLLTQFIRSAPEKYGKAEKAQTEDCIVLSD